MVTGWRVSIAVWVVGCASLAGAQNLIVNGDFEQGNVGFDTDYVYSPGDIWAIGTYDVVHDVTNVHPLATLHHDHTTGTGLLMAANGAWPEKPVVWSQTVPVTPGVHYKFVAWAATWSYSGSPYMAPLEFRVNGTPVAFWENPVAGQWFLVPAIWDACSATTAVITVVDLSVEWNGNDPALDDLWLALLGDMNCDGRVDFDDINPFVMAVSDPVGYHAQYASCNILNGDFSDDGSVNVVDINPLVELLSASPGNGACCYGDDTCAVTAPADCTGTWLGADTACDPSPCPPTGACCDGYGSCALTIQADCARTWLGANTACDPGPCVAATYCWAGAALCSEYIRRVQIDTIDNWSSCATIRFALYTYEVTGWQAMLAYGSPTTLTVTNGYPSTADVCSVWIDWNQDYVFDDAGDERIGDVGGAGPYVFSIVPPMTALPGQTRLRIRMDHNNSNPSPCGFVDYGEVEDYTVNTQGMCGDLDHDGNVDLDDYWILHDAFGTCVGDPKYNPAADMDGDGCITLLDYQAWRVCYLMANGGDFVAPQPKPAPAPPLQALHGDAT
jgi:hypothetical protein